MKPVIIIAIAVVVSIAGTIGVLFAWQEIAKIQSYDPNEEFFRDEARYQLYESQYQIIYSQYCSPPLPESFREAENNLRIMEQNLYNMLNDPELDAIQQKMKLLREKYPDRPAFFPVPEPDCPYDEAYERVARELEEYRIGLMKQSKEVTDDSDTEPLEFCDDDGNCYIFSNPYP